MDSIPTLESEGSDSGKKKHSFPGISFNSPVVLSFAIISLIALIISYCTNGASNRLLFSVYRSNFSFPFVLRLFGHSLGHASWSHFFNNMTLFLLLGPILEEKYKSRNLLFMMLITAAVSGLIFIIFKPYAALLGASGIVFMMIILTSASCIKERKIPLTMILVIAIYLGSEIYSGITKQDSVSHLTHIIGGVCGAVFGFIFNKKSNN